MMNAPKVPQFAQRTVLGHTITPRDLLVDWKEEVLEVRHGAQTHLRFASGRERTVGRYERVQVIRDGRRAARAWLLKALEAVEVPETSLRVLPWYLADALDDLVRSGYVARTARGTFARAA